MVRLLQSGWFLSLLGSLLYFGTIFVLLDPKQIGTLPSQDHAQELKQTTGASWHFVNPEVDRLVDELQRERLALSQQREELQAWAKRLQAEQAELSVITQAVHQAQAEMDRVFLRVDAEEAKSLKRLAKTFAAMETQTAVAVMDQLSEDEMIKLLALMKDDQVTSILEFIAAQGEEQAKRAAALAGRLGEVIPPENAKP